MCKTGKSVLMKESLTNIATTTQSRQSCRQFVYIVDLVASIRTLKENPDTFEEPSFKIVTIIPFGFKRVDMVADSYQSNSVRHCFRELSVKLYQNA